MESPIFQLQLQAQDRLEQRRAYQREWCRQKRQREREQGIVPNRTLIQTLQQRLDTLEQTVQSLQLELQRRPHPLLPTPPIRTPLQRQR